MPLSAIRFIPECFNELELGNFHNGRNPCSPMYPEEAIWHLMNEILINVPEKIILSTSVPIEHIRPVIPVCIARVATIRRGYKYANLSDEVFNIRKADSDEWYQGKVYYEEWDEGEIPGPSPTPEQLAKEKKELQAKIAEAQQYSDDELNVGSGSGSYRNLNLMQYVDMPFEPGVYEIYYSVLGLESNRVKVEIVFEE